MSPEIWDKHLPSTGTTTITAKQESGSNDGVDDQPITTTDNEDKPPSTDDKSPESEDQATKDIEHKPPDTTEVAVED